MDTEREVGDVMVRDALGHSQQKIIFIHGEGRGSAKLCLDIQRVDIALLMSLVECLEESPEGLRAPGRLELLQEGNL